MTNRELLLTLNSCKTVQKLQVERSFVPIYQQPRFFVKDWAKRQVEKNTVFTKYLKILTFCFLGTLLFLILPTALAYPSFGKSLLMGLPPILFMSLSWLLGTWYSWDKERYIFLALTVGAMPLRCGLGLIWVAGISYLPEMNLGALIFGMMVFWMLFTTIEIGMITEFGKKFPRNMNELEPSKI